MIATIIVGAIVAILLVLDVRYIYSQTKKGVCIGCEGNSCSGSCSGCHGNCGSKPMTREEIQAAADKYMEMVKAKSN
ncbi:MAG: FeoB-associated Cys-rich membrane protein [Catonella sp.]|nr:FeoB-associated Cys-rich membrane protein [Catonella sp.]MDY6356813.1 FeoB-associated Cys-rich membrane protein [Catonella sp.]